MRSIFWKIFLLLMLTSTIIVVVGGLLTTMELVQKEEEDRWEQSFRPLVQGIVSQYEVLRELYGSNAGRIPETHGSNFIIFDEENGTLVYGDAAELNFNDWKNTPYTSARNRKYRVNIPKLDFTVYRSLYSYVQYINPFRAWLTLLVSAVFSFLLSLVVIRPIKRLQSHIEIMGSGELDTRLDRKLTRRRDEFGTLARSFNYMAERIQSLVGSKQQLLHDVSHELRAPLARLQVAGELARCEAEVAGIGSGMYDRVDRECSALNKLIDEILTLSRAEATGADSQEQEDCDLPALMEKIVADARFLHTERDIRLEISGAPKPARLVVSLLEKAVKNILENALKYSPDGPVEAALQFDRKRAVISVADRGPGMSQKDLNNIFTPFYRAKAYNSKEGYGLGMSITQKSVRQMGGKIAAGNRRGGGLKVSISLPL